MSLVAFILSRMMKCPLNSPRRRGRKSQIQSIVYVPSLLGQFFHDDRSMQRCSLIRSRRCCRGDLVMWSKQVCNHLSSSNKRKSRRGGNNTNKSCVSIQTYRHKKSNYPSLLTTNDSEKFQNDDDWVHPSI